jgi:hypothetical protein
MSIRSFRTPLTLCATAALLAACGGGGSDTSDSSSGTSTTLESPTNEARARALAAGPALAPAASNLAGNVTCDNLVIGAIRLDSVYVPPQSACRLEGTLLQGNLTAAPGATVEANAVQVGGNVQADGAAHVVLDGSSAVAGSVQIKQGGSALVRGARITGDLQIDAMRGQVSAVGNRVGGSLQAFGNLGGLAIESNTMNGNLQCGENLPAPVVAGNTAALIEGQCVPASGGSGTGGTGGGTVAPTTPLSGNVTCNGLRIGAITLDSVIVPAGASCELDGTRLIGNLEAKEGASLRAHGVRVGGNLQADGAVSTILSGASTIGGSVQLKQGGSASVTGASITGDLQIDGLRGPVTASSNALGGNLQAVANTGGLIFSANRMAGAMQCKDNQPAPTGSGNVASIKQDQCRRL